MAMESMHIGATDADCINAQDNLAIDQLGFRTIEQLQLQRLGVYEGFHGVISVGRKGLISRCSHSPASLAGRWQVSSDSPSAKCPTIFDPGKGM
jgi:hypothetical protein